MTIQRNGALFQLGACTSDDLGRFLGALKDYPKQSELVQAIYDLCSDDPERCTDIASLGERLNIGRSTVLQRVGGLHKLQLITSSMQQTHAGVRPRTVYALKAPTGAVQRLLESRGELIATALPAIAEDSEQGRFDFDPGQFPAVTQLEYHPELQRRLIFKGERFSVFSLLAGLRLGPTGSEAKQKSVRVFMGPRWFDLEVQALGDTRIASVLDLTALIAVTTLLKDYLEHGEHREGAKNGFLVTLTSLCHVMGMDPLPGNKRLLYQRLMRWNSTRFQITQRMYGAADWATGFRTGDHFYFLTRVVVLESLSKSQGATPELLQLFLDQRLVDALLDVDRTLSVHPEILRERKPNAFKHLMYYWCRRVQQHFWEQRIYELEHIRREVRPNLTLKRFSAEFGEFMRDQQIDSSGHVAKIPGYLLRFDPDQGKVAIQAEESDPILGRNSPRSLAEEKKALLGSG